MSKPTLILGSSSRYRQQILNRLGIDCHQISPDVDESALSDTDGSARAAALSEAKALSASEKVDISVPWVLIGSDQVCHRDGVQFSKPGTEDKAMQHLTIFSGSWVTFSTGLTLITDQGQQITRVENFECHFRSLSPTEIAEYIALDQPLDCAGAIKAESAGLTLMDDTRGRDFNTLLGLPVMLLTDMLSDVGYRIFDFKE